MDERYDMMRSLMNYRYLYIHNYRPELPYVQRLSLPVPGARLPILGARSRRRASDCRPPRSSGARSQPRNSMTWWPTPTTCATWSTTPPIAQALEQMRAELNAARAGDQGQRLHPGRLAAGGL